MIYIAVANNGFVILDKIVAVKKDDRRGIPDDHQGTNIYLDGGHIIHDGREPEEIIALMQKAWQEGQKAESGFVL